MKPDGWLWELRRWLRLKPPIWEAPQWEQMSWDEKMAVWQRHRKINRWLSIIYLTCFFGSWAWAVKGGSNVYIAAAFDIIMLMCFVIAGQLID